MEGITVVFKFKLYDRVDTPLVTEGIITMLGYDDGGTTYFVANPEQGVADRWWTESQLAKLRLDV